MTSWTDFNDAAAAPAATSLNLLFCSGRGQSDTHAETLSDGRRNPHKSAGTDYTGITGKEIVTMLREPPSVPKDRAQWFIPSTYVASDARSHTAQRERGEFWFLALDEDGGADNNLTIDEIDAALEQVCGPVARMIYSTRGSTSERRKWRALVPLWGPISGSDYSDTVAAFNAALIEASAGVLIPDPALERCGQLIYLPNRGAHYEHRVVKGDRLELSADHDIIRRREADRARQRQIEAEARKRREQRKARALADPGGAASVIEAFNAQTRLSSELERYGYKRSRNGRDWQSPNSSSGTYAVRDFGEFWISQSGSDAAAEIGNTSPSGARIGDAFDLFQHYEHGGDSREAVKAAAVAMNMDHVSRKAQDMADTLARIGQPDNSGQKPDCPKAKPNKSKFSLIRADKLEFCEPDWLIKGLMEAETLALLFADPGSGKSFVALDMCASIATGYGFHGRDVKRGAVIYICGEGKNGIKRRLRAWERHHGVSLDDAPLFVSSMAGRFLSPESIADMTQAIDAAAQEAGNVAMIVVDTLNRNMGGGDESSTADMTAFISAVDAVKDRYEATALVVHHTGHGNKERARGSMAMLGALDAEYRIEKNDDLVTMTCTKMKEAAPPPPLAFRLSEIEVGQTRLGEAITSAALSETEAPEGGKAKVSKNQRVALEALQQFIADHGKPNPGGTGWPEPGTVKCSDVTEFNEFLQDKMAADKPDSRRRAAQRAVQDLVMKNLAQINGGKIWII